MKDTSPEMEKTYRNLLMSRSGSDRLKMASDMFDTARTLARANLQEQYFTEKEIKENLFLRIYSRDFDPATLDKIIARLTLNCAE